MSLYLFISVVELVSPASSANEHCFAVDVTRRLVIRGWILTAQRAIAVTFPSVGLPAQCIGSVKLIIASTF